jgi:DNA-binding response OmpR family regulator
MNISDLDPKKDQNQIPKEKLYLKDILLWEELEREIPFGLFLVSQNSKLIYINPFITEMLEIDNRELIDHHYQDLFSKLISQAENPSHATEALNEGVKFVKDRSIISFVLRGDYTRHLELVFFQFSTIDNIFPGWGVFIFDRSLVIETINRRIKMLMELSQDARKAGASLMGNFEALSKNFQTWPDDLLGDFFSTIITQLVSLQKSLDQVITALTLSDSFSIYPERIDIKDILTEIVQDKKDKTKLEILTEEDSLVSSSVRLEYGLTKLSLESILREVERTNPIDSHIVIQFLIREEVAIITFLSEDIRHVPDFGDTLQTIPGEQYTPGMYLSQSVIATQGGELAVKESRIEHIPGIWVEVVFPLSQDDDFPLVQEGEYAFEDKESGRILVADSLPEYQMLLQKELTEIGYRVDIADNGSSALDMVQVINPDLVIVDRHLSGLDGVILTQGIRRWSSVPIIMVSSRADPEDLIHAFQMGVDDYIKKPYLLEELFARVKANLRRAKESSTAFTPEIIQAGDLRINHSTRQVWLRGKLIELTPIEFNLLAYMSKHRKQVLTYEQLIERAWDGPEKGSRQALYVHIRRLRKKIESDPKNPQIVLNQWGIGYIFSP